MSMNEKINKIAEEYCDAILKYEIYLNKYSANDLTQAYQYRIRGERNTIDALRKVIEHECTPWRLVEGNLKDYIVELLKSKDMEMMYFCHVSDCMTDELFDVISNQLNKEYSEQGLDIYDETIEDKIQEETFKIIDQDELDSNIYNDEIRKFHKIARRFSKLSDEVFKIYNEKSMNEVEECESDCINEL